MRKVLLLLLLVLVIPPIATADVPPGPKRPLMTWVSDTQTVKRPS